MNRALSQRATPYWLTGPALLVFLGLVIMPLGMTVLLSFYDWGQYKGIVPEFTLKNWTEIFTDSYFFEIFLRTFRIAILVTLACMLVGVPEAYILNRMAPAWRSAFLLVIIGPLLVSVVARTLGWALLLGSTGLVNQGLIGLGLITEPLAFMFTETGVVIVLIHVLIPFMILAVWASLQRLDPQIENAALVARREPDHDLAPGDPAADRAGHPVGRHHRLLAGSERLRLARDHRRPPAQGRGDAGL
jgi:putative spermidine/putrescine transport system permease protein